MATKPVAGVKPADYDEPYGAYNGWQLVVAASVCMGFSTTAIIIRLWVRKHIVNAIGLDDYLCFGAWVGNSVFLTASAQELTHVKDMCYNIIYSRYNT